MAGQLSGEQIGRSIREHPELKNKPAKLTRFLVDHHGLIERDASQIALRLANEPKIVAPPRVKQLELILTQHCNLKCDYCFVGEQSEKMMSKETGRQAIDFLLDASGNLQSVIVTFFGGEPLLAYKLIKDFVLYGEKAALEKGKTIKWRMTTNGTLLNEEKLSFFNEHQVIYLLSIDGDKKSQDAHRQTRTLKSSFEMLDNKFLLMKQYQPWMGARVTVMPDTANRLLDNVKFLVRQGINQFIIEPAEGIEWQEESKRLYLKQMVKVANFYLNNKKNFNLRIDAFDKLASSDTDTKTYTRGCWAGKSSVSVSPDGSIYPCAKFIDPSSHYTQFVLGHISSGITYPDKRKEMIKFPVKTECYDCSKVFDCSGGCPANNYFATGDQALTGVEECERDKMKWELQNAVMEVINTVGLG